jgi:hypothetical protein
MDDAQIRRTAVARISLGSLAGTYDRGWKLVRLYSVTEPKVCTCWKGRDCGTPGKHPCDDAWQFTATDDEDKIAAWLATDRPVNIGVLLGPKSGIIDVELDGPEAAQAWKDLELGEIWTPTYRAGRGPHRLFKWDEALPPVQVRKVRGIEFRFGNGGRASQSVIPPSTHHTGATYQWVEGMSPADLEPAPIPERLLSLLWNDEGGGLTAERRRPARMILQEPVVEGGRNSDLHRFAVREAFRAGPALETPLEQQDLLAKVRAINALQCRPPLSDDEVTAIYRSAIAFVRKSQSSLHDPQSAMEVAGIVKPAAESGAGSGGEATGDAGQSCEHASDGDGTATAKRPKKTLEVFTANGLSFAPLFPDTDSEPEWGPGEWRLTIVHSDPLEYRLHVPAWKPYTANNTGNVSLTVDQYRSATKVAAAVLSATGKIMLDAEPKAWHGIWDGGLKVSDRRSSKTPAARKTKGIKAKLLDIADEEWPGASSLRYVVLAGWLYDRLCAASPPGEDDIPDASGRAAWRQDGTLWFGWSRAWEDIERSHKLSEGERLAFKRRLLARLDMREWNHGRHRHPGDQHRTYVVWTRREFAELERMATEATEDGGGGPIKSL